MLPTHRIPTHPGVILTEEFLRPLGMSQMELAKRLKLPVQRINELVRGRKGITAKTALLLSTVFDVSPQFWMNLQTAHDLGKAREELSKKTRKAG